MSRYGESEYWEMRYKLTSGNFDWLFSFEDASELLQKWIKPTDKVLVTGCGNSKMSAALYTTMGVENITNVDVSSVVIKKMAEQYHLLDKMVWICMDVEMLDFPDASFDVVIEKSLIDALLCDTKGLGKVYKYLRCVDRLLKVDGKFIVFSFGSPDARLDIFKRPLLHFDTQVHPFQALSNKKSHEINTHTSMLYAYVSTRVRGEASEAEIPLPDEDEALYPFFNSKTLRS